VGGSVERILNRELEAGRALSDESCEEGALDGTFWAGRRRNKKRAAKDALRVAKNATPAAQNTI